MTDFYQDTIVAPATIPGTGAISIIRVSGPDTFRIVDSVVQLNRGTISSSDGYTIHYGTVTLEDGTLLDQVLVSVFRAPHSYTGEDSVEISIHASAYIARELVRLLLQSGARFAEPGEFTRRAYLNGKMDLAQAEAVADVISSGTAAAHKVAINQLKGGFSSELSNLRSELLEMASLLELELDFSEEDVEFVSRENLRELLSKCLNHVERLSASFHQGNMIKDGVPVAIVGPANAGKSTLLNALLGEERALVSDIAGTTRDTIEETLSLGGILFRFIDTAGIRESGDSIEKMGIDRTFLKLGQAEIVLAVLDATSTADEISSAASLLLEKVNLDFQKLIILLNKIDKLGGVACNKTVSIINKFVSTSVNKVDIIEISAKQQSGIQGLKDLLLKAEEGLIPNEDAVFVTNSRHYEALLQAGSSLRQVQSALAAKLPSDLIAEDLRRAISSINAILGTNLLSPDTILHSIFSKHCIGK